MEVCAAMQRDKVNAFIGLGGNFICAVPDREPNEAAYILPCRTHGSG